MWNVIVSTEYWNPWHNVFICQEEEINVFWHGPSTFIEQVFTENLIKVKAALVGKTSLALGVRNGTRFWEEPLPRPWIIIPVSVSFHFSFKWYHLVRVVQKPSPLLQKGFFRVFSVYLRSGSLYWHSSMLLWGSYAITVRFWWPNHSPRRRHC